MELFRCVFIFLVAFLSAAKVQSRKVSLSYAGQSTGETVCHGDNYLQAVCSAHESSQCEARADGSSRGNAESRFQLVSVKIDGTRNIKCIQFTKTSTGEKYALKVVNQSRVVFEKHQCDADGNDPEEFRFNQECYRHGRRHFLVYKPFKNQSLCVSKDCVSKKLTLYKYNITQKKTQDTPCKGHNTTSFDRRCAFEPYFL